MQLNDRARALLLSIIGDVAELLAIVGDQLQVTDGAARRYDVRDDNAMGTGVSLNRGERGFSTRDKGQRNGSLEATILESAAGDASPATASEHSAGSRAVVDRALQQGQDLPPSTSQRTCGCGRKGPHRYTCSLFTGTRAPMRCSKCGEAGRRADKCPCNTSTTSAKAADDPRPPQTPTRRSPADSDVVTYQPLAPVGGRPLRDITTSAGIARRRDRAARMASAERPRRPTPPPPSPEECLRPLSQDELEALPIATFVF